MAVRKAGSARGVEINLRRELGRSVRAVRQLPGPLASRLRTALSGGGAKGLRFELSGLSEFERAVLRKALEVPAGQVRSYAWVAREIGRPAAVRAVGSALGRNPISLLIPAIGSCAATDRSATTFSGARPSAPCWPARG